MTDTERNARRVPESDRSGPRSPRGGPGQSPTLDGLEEKWSRRWQEEGTYAFDRSKDRAGVYAIDTPPPTVSGALHMGHLFSYTHTDIVARFRRMRGKAVFYPMGWDDNGLPTERRVQNVYRVRCDPSLAYDPAFEPTGEPTPISRRNFIELCERLTGEDEKAFEQLWRRLGLSVDWSHQYSTIGRDARTASQRAFLRNLARGEAYLAEAPTLWDVTFSTAVAQAELEDRERPGAYHRLRFGLADGDDGGAPDRDDGGAPAGDDGGGRAGIGRRGRPADRENSGFVSVDTTRPELLPACVALVCHPDDARHAHLVGRTVHTPLFGVEVPVFAHPLAAPDKGTGVAMVCTFGDLTDVIWWRELHLPTRAIIGRDGRLLAGPPSGVDSTAYGELAGRTVAQARRRIVELLTERGDLIGEPRPITHPVKFYEKGELPLEIVTSRQWYIGNGGHDLGLRDKLLERGRELRWVPDHMRHRYEHWVSGLTGDWLISRQRFFGVPIPVWYPVSQGGEPDHSRPITPSEARLPVDPASETPEGYEESQRGRPGGFVADPDVMDTWATSSLTPLIASGWERDPDLFGRVYPMDIRPQAHEIIRTWLFASVVRSHLELGVLPWHTTVVSGWVLDPDRKKLSKSSDADPARETLERQGSDAVRYWAANGRPGTDLTFDPGQIKIGRRLATKLLNASRFVVGLQAVEALRAGSVAVTEPLDRSLLAELSIVTEAATSALDSYDHTGALGAVERFFWVFCDDYIELVKERAYSDSASAGARSAGSASAGALSTGALSTGALSAGALSARAALALALSVQLRLFAPFLPYVTEEVWSWWRYGSVHRAPWPSARELGVTGDRAVLAVTSAALHQVRRAKSDRRLSMKAAVPFAEVLGPATELDLLTLAERDLRAAGGIGRLDLLPGRTDSLVIACAF
jgi:valyl-tRNA synthetase